MNGSLLIIVSILLIRFIAKRL